MVKVGVFQGTTLLGKREEMALFNADQKNP